MTIERPATQQEAARRPGADRRRAGDGGSSGRDPGLIRVLVVGSVRLYREGLALSLAGREGFEVATSVLDPARAIAAVIEHRPDIVLLDVSADGATSVVRELKSVDPRMTVVAFAVSETADDVIACAEAGISGYVPADGTVEDLTHTLRRAVRGEIRVPPRIAGVMFQRLAALSGPANPGVALAEMTPRESEILELIGEGLANKQIARRLRIRVATVKNHVHNILEKLDVKTRGEAAALLHTARRPRSH
jgi:two-component system, NarL family, nitrate/nitrite response regulator NarL